MTVWRNPKNIGSGGGEIVESFGFEHGTWRMRCIFSRSQDDVTRYLGSKFISAGWQTALGGAGHTGAILTQLFNFLFPLSFHFCSAHAWSSSQSRILRSPLYWLFSAVSGPHNNRNLGRGWRCGVQNVKGATGGCRRVYSSEKSQFTNR